MQPSETNQRLGYTADARLLIINADDFGMLHAANAAIIDAIRRGMVSSTTLMVPCPWAQHAMRLLAENPDIPFGIHLTAVSDASYYGFRPLTARERVPSLVDKAGFLHHSGGLEEFLAKATRAELEVEFRAQIEAVLGAGLKPTHLDWHSVPIERRPDMAEVILALAREYGLAMRTIGQGMVDLAHGLDLPCTDQTFLDSYTLSMNDKPGQFARLLRDLPVGLSEWAVHPGLDTPEMQTIEPDAPVRPTDYAFVVSDEARALIQKEGVTVIDYRPLQAYWQGVS